MRGLKNFETPVVIERDFGKTVMEKSVHIYIQNLHLDVTLEDN